MAYCKATKIPKKVYHYTQRNKLPLILESGKIIAFDGKECWFCLTLPDLVKYLELTAFNEGQHYISSDGSIKEYPAFKAEDYIVLELRPRYSKDKWYYYEDDYSYNDFTARNKQILLSKAKIGYRGDLEFKSNPPIIEMADIIHKYLSSEM